MPKGTFLRTEAIRLLGQDQHHGYDPVSIYFLPPSRTEPGWLDLAWCSDDFEPLRRPQHAGYLMQWGPAPTHDAFAVRSGSPELVFRGSHEDIRATVAAGPVFTEFRMRSESPLVLGDYDLDSPPEPLTSARLIDATFTRWMNDVRWFRDAGPKRCEGRMFPQAFDLRREMQTNCILSAAHHVDPSSAWQVATKARRPQEKRAISFDVHLRYGGINPVGLRWFNALLLAASQTSIGRWTNTGAGAVTVEPIAESLVL